MTTKAKAAKTAKPTKDIETKREFILRNILFGKASAKIVDDVIAIYGGDPKRESANVNMYRSDAGFYLRGFAHAGLVKAGAAIPTGK